MTIKIAKFGLAEEIFFSRLFVRHDFYRPIYTILIEISMRLSYAWTILISKVIGINCIKKIVIQRPRGCQITIGNYDGGDFPPSQVAQISFSEISGIPTEQLFYQNQKNLSKSKSEKLFISVKQLRLTTQLCENIIQL